MVVRESKAKVILPSASLLLIYIRRTMAKKAGARYLDSSIPVQKKTIRGRLSLLLAATTALVAIVGSLFLGVILAYSSSESGKPSLSSASAISGICGTIGENMDGRSGWKANWDVALPDASNRQFALSEVVPNATWWSHFTGPSSAKSDEDFIIGRWDENVEELNVGRPDEAKLPTVGEIGQPALENYRNLPNCTINKIPGALGGLGLNFANFVTKISSFIATMAFNSSFICDVEPSPGQICIDLLAIIGGRDNDAGQGGTGEGGASGIIGSLTTGLYKPLMILVVLATALTVAWTGLVQRKFREAFFQAIWLAASVIVGLALLLNPSMLVKAPMVIGNTIVGCVVGAFNGSGCTGDQTIDPSSDTSAKSKVCVTDASGLTAEQKTTLYISSMTCSIWSAFVLEPYAQGAYGVSLSQLDRSSVIDASTGQTVEQMLESPGWSPPGMAEGGDMICVNLRTNESFNSMGNTFVGNASTSGDGAICNLAVWDLFMKTNAVGGAVTSAEYNPDPKWLAVMSRLPANDALFKHYVDDAGGWSKFNMGGLAAIASVLASLLIVAVSILALVYYVIAIIMVAFAPVFFLFGMHPGRGKKIMLGWLEQIISNIMKYLISAVFLLIAITFYGAILGTSTSFIASLLFIVIVTMALWMYRKELISLLSRVDMGGEKMTDMADKFMDKSQSFGKKVWKPTKSVAAGAVAGALTGAGAGVGAKTSLMRELRQGNGMVARGFQAADAISADNENDLYKTEKAKREDARSQQDRAADAEKDAEEAVNAALPYINDKVEAFKELNQATENHEEVMDEVSAKAELDGKIDVAFGQSDYAQKRAEREVVKYDKDGNAYKETSSQAYSNVQDIHKQLADARAEYKELAQSGDHEGLDRNMAKQRSLEVKLKAEQNEFKSSHGKAGAAEAYADMRRTQGSIKDMEMQEMELRKAGDIEAADGIRDAKLQLRAELSEKHEVFTNTYGQDEFRRANEAYNRTSTEFVKQNFSGEEREAMERLNSTSRDELNDKLGQAIDRKIAADEKLGDANSKLNDAMDIVERRIELASQARTDATKLTAEADTLRDARTEITPGMILTTGKADKFRSDAEVAGAATAQDSSEFGSSLKESLATLNEKIASVQQSADASGNVREMNTLPTTMGQSVRDVESRRGAAVIEKQEEISSARIKENETKIRAAEEALQQAEKRLEEARRQDTDIPRERGRFGLPTRPDADTVAAQQRVQQAEESQKQAEALRLQAKEEFERNKARFEQLSSSVKEDSSPEAIQALSKFKQEMEDAKSNLSKIQQEADTAARERAQAQREFNERMNRNPEQAERAYQEALRKAQEVGARGARTVAAPEATKLSVQGTPSEQILNQIEKQVSAAVNNADKLSANEKARLLEVEKRLSSLGANPSEEAIKNILKMVPDANKGSSGGGGLAAALANRKNQGRPNPNGDSLPDPGVIGNPPENNGR